MMNKQKEKARRKQTHVSERANEGWKGQYKGDNCKMEARTKREGSEGCASEGGKDTYILMTAHTE
jgi:hypothetical protein